MRHKCTLEYVNSHWSYVF